MSGFIQVKRDEFTYDQRLIGLSDQAFRLHTYLWQGFGQNVCGLRRFMVPEALAWGLTDLETAQAALDELIGAELAIYDPQMQLLFIPLCLEHSPIVGLNSIKHAAKTLQDAPDSLALVPVIEHLLIQIPPEAAALEAKAEQSPSGDKGGKLAQKGVRELSGITENLLARLARIKPDHARATDGPGRAGQSMGTPTAPGADGVIPLIPRSDKEPTPPGPHAKGVWTPSYGGVDGVSALPKPYAKGVVVGGISTTIYCGSLALAAQFNPAWTPCQGGMEGVRAPCRGDVMGVSRARAYVRTDTYPETETPTPLKAPPNLRMVAGRGFGQEFKAEKTGKGSGDAERGGA